MSNLDELNPTQWFLRLVVVVVVPDPLAKVPPLALGWPEEVWIVESDRQASEEFGAVSTDVAVEQVEELGPIVEVPGPVQEAEAWVGWP